MWVLSKVGRGGVLVDCTRFEAVPVPDGSGRWAVMGWEKGKTLPGETLAVYQRWETAWRALEAIGYYIKRADVCVLTSNLEGGEPVDSV